VLAQTPIYAITHSLLESHFAQLFRPQAKDVVAMVSDIGRLRVKLMFSRGNYDTHSNKRIKLDISMRILITKAIA